MRPVRPESLMLGHSRENRRSQASSLYPRNPQREHPEMKTPFHPLSIQSSHSASSLSLHSLSGSGQEGQCELHITAPVLPEHEKAIELLRKRDAENMRIIALQKARAQDRLGGNSRVWSSSTSLSDASGYTNRHLPPVPSIPAGSREMSRQQERSESSQTTPMTVEVGHRLSFEVHDDGSGDNARSSVGVRTSDRSARATLSESRYYHEQMRKSQLEQARLSISESQTVSRPRAFSFVKGDSVYDDEKGMIEYPFPKTLAPVDAPEPPRELGGVIYNGMLFEHVAEEANARRQTYGVRNSKGRFPVKPYISSGPTGDSINPQGSKVTGRSGEPTGKELTTESSSTQRQQCAKINALQPLTYNLNTAQPSLYTQHQSAARIPHVQSWIPQNQTLGAPVEAPFSNNNRFGASAPTLIRSSGLSRGLAPVPDELKTNGRSAVQGVDNPLRSNSVDAVELISMGLPNIRQRYYANRLTKKDYHELERRFLK